jgi:hypothetical protein
MTHDAGASSLRDEHPNAGDALLATLEALGGVDDLSGNDER